MAYRLALSCSEAVTSLMMQYSNIREEVKKKQENIPFRLQCLYFHFPIFLGGGHVNN